MREQSAFCFQMHEGKMYREQDLTSVEKEDFCELGALSSEPGQDYCVHSQDCEDLCEGHYVGACSEVN